VWRRHTRTSLHTLLSATQGSLWCRLCFYLCFIGLINLKVSIAQSFVVVNRFCEFLFGKFNREAAARQSLCDRKNASAFLI
jgi:hypothetical protein